MAYLESTWNGNGLRQAGCLTDGSVVHRSTELALKPRTALNFEAVRPAL